MSINNAIELEAVTVSEEDENGQGPPDHAGEQGPPDHAGEQGPPDHAPAPGYGDTEYAWLGVFPETIEGEINPTLSLLAGEEYTVEWTNTTDTSHNFVMVDDNGEEIVASDDTSEEGESEIVEFTATEEMAAYYCDSHPDQMGGEIVVESAREAVFEVSDLDPTETTIDQGESIEISATIDNTGDDDGTQEISLVIDDETVDSQELTLDAGNDETVTFEEIGTSDFELGEYTFLVTTEDDVASGTLIIEDDGEVRWHRDLDVSVNPEEATNWNNYEITKILDQGDFMDIDVAPDGRVFYVTRGHQNTGGTEEELFEVGYVDPDTGEHEIVFERETFTATQSGADDIDTNTRETGGQGLALDPNFEDNGYIYLNYHPRLDEMDDIGPSPYDEFWDGEVQNFGYKVVSRFEKTSDGIDPESETEIIRIPQQYDSCCHHGGNLEFGPEGNLWISVGDDSEIVDDWSGLDDREVMHPAYDVARTSGNTADLRGSILRITPKADGDYAVPEGNLKEIHENRLGEEFDDEEFRPEIFSLGYRNPYVISVDDHTGFLFTGEYSPGFGSWDDSERGPSGIAGFRLIDEPDFAGWPFFQGYYSHRRFDYDTEELGQPYWIDRPRNTSRNNTGIEYLPPFEPDLIWQPQNGQDNPDHYVPPAWADMPRPDEVTWPELQGSGGNNAGPTYRYSDDYSANALPPYFEGNQFAITSYGTHQSIWYITLNEDGSVNVDEFLPDAPWVGQTPHHMEIGPDGRAYVSNYGDGFYMVEYQGPPPEWEAPPEEEWPARVEPSEDGLGIEPPEDATILWDGDETTLADWEHSDWSPGGDEPTGADAQWIEEDGYFETVPESGDLRPAIDGIGSGLGDYHLHVEWRLPEGVDDTGNSGVFMMERYEIQILDDGDWDPEQLAGTYYLAGAPLSLPLRSRGEWNEFDIFWRTPEFEDEEVVRYPQLTVFFNGVPTKYHFDVPGPNWGGINDFDDEEFGHPTDEDGEFAEEWPFFLQEHGDIVQFRNIWCRDIPERSVEIDQPDELPTYDTSAGEGDPERIDAGGPGTTGEAPEDAEVLIEDSLTLEPGKGDWESDDEYGDAQFHIEYQIPEDVDGEGPWRGSSGALMMGNYEINIVDTWENPVAADEWAGSYTHQAAPHHDAVREPGEWQHLDILWQAPRFEDGTVSQPAQVTALLNGVAVQTRLEVDGPNNGVAVREYSEHGEKALRLREDGDEIQFRNTWVRSFESSENGEDEPPEELSLPYGLDAGGVQTGTVEVDGLQFDESHDDNEFTSVTGDISVSAPSDPAPEDLEFDGTNNDLLYASEIHGEEFGLEIDVPEGTYDVTLHFSEWPHFEDDQVPRLQNVYLQDDLVLEEFECLRGEAQVKTFKGIEISDEQLSIGLEVHPDSEDAYAKINGLEIHETDDDDPIPDEAVEPNTAIELDGQTSGWVGIKPDDIADEENPELVLIEGEEYEIGWTTGDGGNHNIAIWDEDDNIIDDLSTEVTNDPGDEQWLQFEATSEMYQYVCEPHESMMVGDIDIR
jgi:plastocyanin/glucose/arabinose dehydrogenase